MPGVFQLSIDSAVQEIEDCKKLGITSFILFGIPTVKDSIGSDTRCANTGL